MKPSRLARAAASATPRTAFIPFNSGLDIVTPSIQTAPGSVRDCINWAVDINGGYYQPDGYERFDGRPKPSDAAYYILYANVTGSIVAGDDITGGTSSATGTVVAVNDTYVDGETFLVLTKVSGTFQDGEDIEVSAVVEGTADGTQTGAAPTAILNAIYRNLAADEYRADIAAVPGSGSVLGVWWLDGDVFAVRNNAGGTAAVIHKATSGGWTSVAIGRELAFTSGGTTEIVEGNTITGATSGATAVVTRVCVQSGSWAAGTAAGRLIFASQTGTFSAEDLNVGASLNVASIAANSSAITLLPGGRFETIRTTFTGTSDERIYGCDGVNRGFEFDGTVFAPIATGMATDTPTHVAEFKKHLFFSFDASAQHSGLGTPFAWTATSGAAELATGDTITAFEVQPGSQGTMAIFSRNRTHVLYGSSSEDWNLVRLKKEVGAYAYTTQEVGQTMLFDDRGIANLETTDQYGNFKGSTLSRLIQPFLNQRRGSATASCISRNASQYRLFFSDKYALYVTIDGNQVKGMMTQYFQEKVTCICSQEETDGSESIYFGSDDGYVYQLDRGTSHDGDEIERRLVLNFFSDGSPRILKTFKDVAIETKAFGYAEFNLGFQLGYNSTEYSQALDLVYSSAYWDEFVWDSFVWDGVALSPIVGKLEGSAENISLVFRSLSDYFYPLTFSGASLRYTARRQLRS